MDAARLLLCCSITGIISDTYSHIQIKRHSEATPLLMQICILALIKSAGSLTGNRSAALSEEAESIEKELILECSPGAEGTSLTSLQTHSAPNDEMLFKHRPKTEMETSCRWRGWKFNMTKTQTCRETNLCFTDVSFHQRHLSCFKY